MILDIFINALTNPGVVPFILMFLSGYIILRLVVDKNKLKELPEFERTLIALGIGFLFEYALFFPATLSITYWLPFYRQNYSETFIVSVLAFCFVSALLLFFRLNYNVSEKRMRKMLLCGLIVAVGCFWGYLIFSIIVGTWTVAWYDSYILEEILGDWKGFVGLNIIYQIVFSAGAVTSYYFIIRPLGTIFQRPKLTRRRKLAITLFILATIIGSIVIVPIDKQYNLFTPRIEFDKETYGDYESIVLFIFADRVSKDTVQNTLRFYRLRKSTYLVSTSNFFPLVNSVYIKNPSNTSFIAGKDSPFVDAGEDWKQVWVNVPEEVRYDFMTELGKVEGIKVSFANIPRTSFLVNLSYWNQVPESLVSIEYTAPAYVDLGNHTWIEKHTYVIKNDADYYVDVPAFEFNRFTHNVVNRNSVKAYYNGQAMPWAELIWPYRLCTLFHIPAHTVANFTVSFVVYDVS